MKFLINNKIRLLILGVYYPIFCSSQIIDCWEPTNGPYGGYCNVLKEINNNIYAGTDCGIYSTNDNGITWSNKSAGLGSCKLIQDIDIVNSVMIAGTLDSGIYISNDFGINWVKSNSGLNDPFLDQHIYDVFVNGNDVLIGTANGVFKSVNQGMSWTPSNIGISEPVNINANRFAKIGSTLFLCTLNNIYKSIDNGFTWINLNATISINSLSLVSLGNLLYVTSPSGIYKSANNGSTWSIVNNNLPFIPYMLFAANNNLYCSQNALTYVSTNGGVNWTIVTNSSFNSIIESSIKVFGGNANSVVSWNLGTTSVVNSGLGGAHETNDIYQDGSVMYVGNNNGIYRSQDNGNTWVNKSVSLPLNTIVNCITKCGNNLIIGTKGKGVFLSNDNGNTWIQSNSGLSNNGVNYSNITALHTYNGRVFMGAKENIQFYDFASLFVSDNNGVSWSQSAIGLEPNVNVSSICNFGTYLIIGSKDEFSPSSFNDGVYLSIDNGATWLFDGLSASINAVCANNTGYLAASSDIIYTTTDMGNSWSSYDFGVWNNSINSISNINNQIYLVKDAGVYFSSSNGWNLMSSGCLSDGHHKDLVANTAGTLFIGARAVVPYNGWYYELNNGVSKNSGFFSEIKEKTKPSKIIISPNPASDNLTISIPEQFIGTSYTLCDQFGKTLFKGNLFETTNTIDLTNLASGIYFLSVEGMDEVERVLKN